MSPKPLDRHFSVHTQVQARLTSQNHGHVPRLFREQPWCVYFLICALTRTNCLTSSSRIMMMIALLWHRLIVQLARLPSHAACNFNMKSDRDCMHIGMSPALFKVFASESVGVISVAWKVCIRVIFCRYRWQSRAISSLSFVIVKSGV